MRTYTLLAMLTVALVPASRGATLYSNLGNTPPGYNTGSTQPLYNFIWAQQFQAATTAYVTEVDLPLDFSNDASGNTTDLIQIFDDNGGVPGNVLDSTTYSGPFLSDTTALIRTAFFSGTVQLVQGDVYYVVVQTENYSDPTVTGTWWSSEVRNRPVVVYFNGGWVYEDSGGEYPPELAVDVIGADPPASVPEPGTLGVCGMALCAIAALAMRRRLA